LPFQISNFRSQIPNPNYQLQTPESLATKEHKEHMDDGY
jgi:hypothetical protein